MKRTSSPAVLPAITPSVKKAYTFAYTNECVQEVHRITCLFLCSSLWPGSEITIVTQDWKLTKVLPLPLTTILSRNPKGLRLGALSLVTSLLYYKMLCLNRKSCVFEKLRMQIYHVLNAGLEDLKSDTM